ncbi:MAG TPA: serine/threonine protein kinase [Armatimonadota bacterium]|nr:serine/threonine protein kinase [Armatimonadota bacterium]
MGVVYCGFDRQLNRTVAIKVLPPEFTHDTTFLHRFKNEILNSAKLDHPNIVQIYDVGEDHGTNYYVMQFIDGHDLRSEIARRGQFSLNEAIDVIYQVAKALDYAHQNGIVHRDVKPDNVLIDHQGIARVVDFGIAKTVEGTNMTGGMIGTPEYMSPEQARGEALDGRSDQYALGLVAYEMLTGRTPFKSETSQPWALVNMHISTPPPDPRQWQQVLPEYAVHALLQSLAKIPSYRFSTCVDFAAALRGDVSVTTPPISAFPQTVVSPMTPLATAGSLPPEMPYRRTSNQPIVVGVFGIVIACLLVGGGTMIYRPELVGIHQTLQQPRVPQPVAPPIKQAVPVKEPPQKIQQSNYEEDDYSDVGSEEPRIGKVVGKGARVRQSPSKDGVIIAQKETAPAMGTSVEILQKHNAWYYIRYNFHGKIIEGWTYAGLVASENSDDYGVTKIDGEWRAYDRQTNIVTDPFGRQYPLQLSDW